MRYIQTIRPGYSVTHYEADTSLKRNLHWCHYSLFGLAGVELRSRGGPRRDMAGLDPRLGLVHLNITHTFPRKPRKQVPFMSFGNVQRD